MRYRKSGYVFLIVEFVLLRAKSIAQSVAVPFALC